MPVFRGPARLKMDLGTTRMSILISTFHLPCLVALSASLLWSCPIRAAETKASSSTSFTGAAVQISALDRSVVQENDGWVEIEFPASELVVYKERRPAHQVTFNFQYEPVSFPNMLSILDAQTYTNLFAKSTTDLYGLSLGWKVNFPIVGFDFEALYARGVVADTRSGQTVSLAVNKKGVKGLLVIDGIFAENYVVPYVGVEYLEWDVAISNDFASASLTTGPSMGMTGGIYIPLSWIEPIPALNSYNSHRLNNTYLDLFVKQYQKPSNSGDPDLSGTSFGAGLKLEF